MNVDENLVHGRLVPWLAKCDQLVGRIARNQLAQRYSFCAAFRAGLSPSEAVRAAIENLEIGYIDRGRP